MSRYVVKFKKEGVFRFTSHLDVMRFFQRSLNRADIKLLHSQGFNPHPKMSFAQPLSLGYTSTGEYLEFETTAFWDLMEIMKRLNAQMVEGICLTACKEIPEQGKALAALVEFGTYEIAVPAFVFQDVTLIEASLQDFLNQDSILVTKLQKKSGKEVELNLKPMIRELKYREDGAQLLFEMTICTGSVSNLNPELLFRSFCEFHGTIPDKEKISVERKELFYKGKQSGELIPFDHFGSKS